MILYNCRAVLPDRVVDNAIIMIRAGLIECIRETPAAAELPQDEVMIDAGGLLVGPGFVDVHCHGDGRIRFFDAPEQVAVNLARGGVTTVLGTLGYPDMRSDLKPQVARFMAALGPVGRQIVGGVHLEGPYVNPKYGAQTNRGIIKPPDLLEYQSLLETFPDTIKWWTCAPELPGAMEFIQEASAAGVRVGAGHTEATPDEIAASIKAGLSIVIHWSNATGNPRAAAFAGTRTPGIDEAALVHDELTAEIIPDEKGLHVHPLMARLLFKTKGPDRIVIITDAGYGRPDDPPEPPGQSRDVSIDVDGNLAGSRLTMAGAARNFRCFTGCSWPELFRMTSLNAARLLGLDDRVGSIAPGKLANLVLVDENLNVARSFVAGRDTADYLDPQSA
jgi:N-acetylglucosamine-6-phosphate deacetylase